MYTYQRLGLNFLMATHRLIGGYSSMRETCANIIEWLELYFVAMIWLKTAHTYKQLQHCYLQAPSQPDPCQRGGLHLLSKTHGWLCCPKVHHYGWEILFSSSTFTQHSRETVADSVTELHCFSEHCELSTSLEARPPGVWVCKCQYLAQVAG